MSFVSSRLGSSKSASAAFDRLVSHEAQSLGAREGGQAVEEMTAIAEQQSTNGGFQGKLGWELQNASQQPCRNLSTKVNGRQYSAHATDQMQNRGIMPSMVENTIKNGTVTAGKQPGTIRYYDSVNDLTVILNSETGRVITTGFGQIGNMR